MARNQEVKIKLDSKERRKLEINAKRLGLKPSQYIRMVSLNANIKVKDSNNEK